MQLINVINPCCRNWKRSGLFRQAEHVILYQTVNSIVRCICTSDINY